MKAAMFNIRFVLALLLSLYLHCFAEDSHKQFARVLRQNLREDVNESCAYKDSAVQINFIFLLYSAGEKFQIPQRRRNNFFKMLDLCLESINRSQNNAKVHIGIPEQQLGEWNTALSGHSINVISIEAKPPKEKSWIFQHTFYQSTLLQSTLQRFQNVVLAEPDQLYWTDLSPVFSNNFDIGVTFTKRRISRKSGCLNSGVIFIKNVTESVINLWKRYTLETDEVCEKYGCENGGENQRALCDILGGPGRKNEKRTISDGIIVQAFDRHIYNVLTPTSCSRTSSDIHMTHFKGSLKNLMIAKECRSQYLQSSGTSISCLGRNIVIK